MIALFTAHLSTARCRQFVGRERERGMFRAASLAQKLPFQVWQSLEVLIEHRNTTR